MYRRKIGKTQNDLENYNQTDPKKNNKNKKQSKTLNCQDKQPQWTRQQLLDLRPTEAGMKNINCLNIELRPYREMIKRQFQGNFLGSSPPPRGNFTIGRPAAEENDKQKTHKPHKNLKLQEKPNNKSTAVS